VNPHQHDPRDCPTTTCRYCDGTADMWMLGELAVAPFRVLWWLACHPLVAIILIAAGLVVLAVL
jgi:hypothetical protein